MSDVCRANGKIPATVDTSAYPGLGGLTFELCAGILDKEGATVLEVAQQEILEECGYDVPTENMEVITTTRYYTTKSDYRMNFKFLNSVHIYIKCSMFGSLQIRSWNIRHEADFVLRQS